jgi:hypothetical protein
MLRFIFLFQPQVNIIYMSEGLKIYYESFCKIYARLRKVRVIPNYFVRSSTSVKAISSHKRPYICFVGTIADQFCFEELKKLREMTNPGFDIRIAGDGPNFHYYQREFAQMKNVYFIGKIDYDEALALMSNSFAMFVFYRNPAVFENHLTNKIVEAVSLSKPIIHNLPTNAFTVNGCVFRVGVSLSSTSIQDAVALAYSGAILDDSKLLKEQLSREVVEKDFIKFCNSAIV